MRLIPRFPLFSAYVAAVFLSTLVMFLLRPVTSDAYKAGYWIAEFLQASLAYGITWEIYSHTLKPYPGVRRVAWIVLSAVFVLIAGRAGAELVASRLAGVVSTAVEFERDLRVIQAFLLVAISGLIVYFALPVGRNVRSILTGYGLYLCLTVLTLGFYSDLSPALQAWSGVLRQSGWNAAALIWCIGMWSYCPNPRDPGMEMAEADCREAAEAIGRVREYMVEPWRL